MTQEPCTCGETDLGITEEGYHQPVCWECFYRENPELVSDMYSDDRDALPF
jgi:hypothetical protein